MKGGNRHKRKVNKVKGGQERIKNNGIWTEYQSYNLLIFRNTRSGGYRDRKDSEHDGWFQRICRKVIFKRYIWDI